MNPDLIKHSNNPRYQDNVLLQKTFAFSVDILSYCNELETLKKWNLANQLFRSGTSIGANCREAQNGESKKDFIHKLKIVLKEADETEYWLFLCGTQESVPETSDLINSLNEITKLLNKIISSTVNNMNAG